MKIFITGATGYIGGSIALDLRDAGHSVHGLARSADKAAALRALGILPVQGDLADHALLTREAGQADAVINAASSDDRGAVEALLRGLRGSGKAFLHTSGSSVIGDGACGERVSDQVFDEDTPLLVEPDKEARHAIDRLILDAAADKVRSVVLCNSMIYGNGSGLHRDSAQIPTLIAQARKSGVLRVVGHGLNRWSNVHVADVVDVYRRALTNAPAGAFYFVENGEASFAEIGAALAQRLDLGAMQPWPIAEAAAEWGESRARYSLGSNSRVRARRARRELHWMPRHASITDWILNEMPLD